MIVALIILIIYSDIVAFVAAVERLKELAVGLFIDSASFLIVDAINPVIPNVVLRGHYELVEIASV